MRHVLFVSALALLLLLFYPENMGKPWLVLAAVLNAVLATWHALGQKK